MTDSTPPSTMRIAVQEAITAIRPIIQMDGGDIALHDVYEDTGVVVVELTGACVGCPASNMTLKAGVERILQDRVPGVTEVRALGLDLEEEDPWDPSQQQNPVGEPAS